MEAQMEALSRQSEAEQLLPTPSASFEQHGAEGEWHAGYCSCGNNLGICCTGLWCPCVLFGQNVELLAKEGAGSGTFGVSCFNFWAIPTVFSCASLGLLAALGVFSSHPAASPLILRSIEHGCNAAGAAGLAGYASRRRRQLRQLEGLPEGPLSDWCTYFWCPSLTVCQDSAQLRHRRQARLNAEAGAYQQAAVQPPAQQRMS